MCFNSLSQIAVETEGSNILYRGFNNKVIIGSTEKTYDSLVVENGSISSSTTNGYYIIKPFRFNTCTLHALVFKENSIDTIDSKVFIVYNLPKPSLWWGTSNTGEKAQLYSNAIFARYDASVPLNARFNILDWECVIGEKTYKDKGNTLTEDFLIKVRSLPEGETISIICTVGGPDGIARKLAGSWTR